MRRARVAVRRPTEQFSRRKYAAMAIPATQLRPGMIIKHNNDLHAVFSVEHRTPGNLRAFIQAKLRNLRTGAMFEHRFRSADAIEKINVDEVSMEYLYNDGDDYYFMNTENFEQTHLKKDVLGDAVDYLASQLPENCSSTSFNSATAVTPWITRHRSGGRITTTRSFNSATAVTPWINRQR